MFSDSQLAVKQVNDEVRVLDDRLTHYKVLLVTLTMSFEKVQIRHIPRSRNTQADTLLKLVALGNLDERRLIIVMEIPHPSVDHPQALLTITDDLVEEE
jgi:ribonuclease HI